MHEDASTDRFTVVPKNESNHLILPGSNYVIVEKASRKNGGGGVALGNRVPCTCRPGV